MLTAVIVFLEKDLTQKQIQEIDFILKSKQINDYKTLNFKNFASKKVKTEEEVSEIILEIYNSIGIANEVFIFGKLPAPVKEAFYYSSKIKDSLQNKVDIYVYESWTADKHIRWCLTGAY